MKQVVRELEQGRENKVPFTMRFMEVPTEGEVISTASLHTTYYTTPSGVNQNLDDNPAVDR